MIPQARVYFWKKVIRLGDGSALGHVSVEMTTEGNLVEYASWWPDDAYWRNDAGMFSTIPPYSNRTYNDDAAGEGCEPENIIVIPGKSSAGNHGLDIQKMLNHWHEIKNNIKYWSIACYSCAGVAARLLIAGGANTYSGKANRWLSWTPAAIAELALDLREKITAKHPHREWERIGRLIYDNHAGCAELDDFEFSFSF